VIPDLNSAEPAVTLVTPARLQQGVWVPILLYHYVRVAPPSDRVGVNLSVTPPTFAKQMHYLRDHGFTTMTMRQLDDALLQHRPLPPRPLVLTFDDGYRDFYTAAAPVMRELGITATEYIPTELVGRPNYMTWAQIQELDAQGFEMGAHSEFHVDLTHLSQARLQLEIEGCKAQLESHLGHPVVDFAYPYGKFDPVVEAEVRSVGFWSATTTVQGGVHNSDQMFTLTRMRVGESLLHFESLLLPVVVPGAGESKATN
jgi:peptidoglycan/xylan/chitin deacetylase (PgdA/CDA1 family)